MNMNPYLRKMTAVLMLSTLGSAGVLTLSACDGKDGPAEEIGESMDEAAQDTKREVEDATD